MATTNPNRLLSVDALRGFDMLMIAGAGTFIERLYGKTSLPWVDALALQFTHPDWHGFTFYDFIFPLFLFLAGVSMHFSLQSGLDKGLTKDALLKKVAKRAVILFILGIFDKNIPVDFFNPSNIRYGTVLGRIGIASFFGALSLLYLPKNARIPLVIGILLLYYAAIFMIPVPGFGAGNITFEGNLVGWFDRTFMPGILRQGTYDENAILTQFPAMCLTIIGTIVGDFLSNNQFSGVRKVQYMIGIGLLCIGIGLLWNFHFPINKHLWSSSFICVTAGMALLLLSFFYGTIEVLQLRNWTLFFEVVGANSITIYLLYRYIDFERTAYMLFGGLYKGFDPQWHNVFSAIGGLILIWLVMFFLYKRKIFFRI